MPHGGVGLLIVRGPDVEHVAAEGVAQPVGTCERPHEGDARLVDKRQDAHGGGGAHIAGEGEHLSGDELFLRVGETARGVVAIVTGVQFDASTVYPAGIVDVVDVGQCPAQCLDTEIPGVAGEG